MPVDKVKVKHFSWWERYDFLFSYLLDFASGQGLKGMRDLVLLLRHHCWDKKPWCAWFGPIPTGGQIVNNVIIDITIFHFILALALRLH